MKIEKQTFCINKGNWYCLACLGNESLSNVDATFKCYKNESLMTRKCYSTLLKSRHIISTGILLYSRLVSQTTGVSDIQTDLAGTFCTL